MRAWFVDAQGQVTEGSSSNAWIVTKRRQGGDAIGGSGILAGITRSVLTDVMAALQIKFEERPFTPEEAYEAAEAHMTASSQIVNAGRPDRRPEYRGRHPRSSFQTVKGRISPFFIIFLSFWVRDALEGPNWRCLTTGAAL